MAQVTYYGADWCRDCTRSKALLNKLNVEFEERNVEHTPAFADEAQAISGRTNIPVIKFSDGEFFVEPSDKELEEALAKRGLVA
ncbi:MAG: glutaredoxin family protein [Micrococcales bacterium]